MSNKNNNLINYFLTKLAAGPNTNLDQQDMSIMRNYSNNPKQLENNLMSNAKVYSNIFDDNLKAHAHNSTLTQANHLPIWERFKAMLYRIFGKNSKALNSMQTNAINDVQERQRGMYNTMVKRYEKQFGKGSFFKHQTVDPNSKEGQAYRAWMQNYANMVKKKTQAMQQRSQNIMNQANNVRGIGSFFNSGFMNAANTRFNDMWNDRLNGYENRKKTMQARIMDILNSQKASPEDINRYVDLARGTLNTGESMFASALSPFYDTVRKRVMPYADKAKMFELYKQLIYNGPSSLYSNINGNANWFA